MSDKYVTALDCGHGKMQVSSNPPTTASIALCPVCGQWRGVVVLFRPDEATAAFLDSPS